MQVLNKEADDIKTYPIKEGSALYKGMSSGEVCAQLMRIDEENTLLCFCTEAVDWEIYHFHHLEKD